MKKFRFTEHQIVGILNEAEFGVPVKNVCRKHGASSATYYKWKSKYGGLEAAEGLGPETAQGTRVGAGPVQAHVRRLDARELCAQGRHLKKALTAAEKRQLVSDLVAEHELPVARSCRAACVVRVGIGRRRARWRAI